jgi:hypothetical protein
MQKYWDHHPPVHIMLASFFGYKKSEISQEDFFDLIGAPSSPPKKEG